MNNPDVLSCLANLSSDEVFTPPKVVNAMLDMLPQDLFKSPDTTFLDPACKTGVFLREIAKRLIEGLKDKIPDLNDRIEHIFRKQLYGIAITELTGLISRRTLYCTMNPSNKYSVCEFDNSDGNIRFIEGEHVFERERCKYCGASDKNFGRSEGLATHAYEFIHTTNPERIFNMKFDVIISNPPYQLSTSGSVASQAIPIYQKFFEQAKELNPKYIVMIMPSRWMNGGFGLDEFRKIMLNDKHIRVLHDYLNSEECFPGITLAGGVCYFLRERDSEGTCKIFSHRENQDIIKEERYLFSEDADTFIRFHEALSILKKIRAFHEKSFSSIVSQRDPFGLNYYENGKECMFKIFDKNRTSSKVQIYSFGWKEDSPDYAEKKFVTTNHDAVEKYKVFISKANGAASAKAPYAVLSKPFVGNPNTICNMTYLMIGMFDTKEEAKNIVSYIATKFFRFLVSLLKNTQNAYKKVYELVPMQDFSKSWTDEELYKKYGLDENEIVFIESMIRPMELDNTKKEK